MTITSETKVGQLAAQHPLATRVFARHGIDFCCGGGEPLGAVCAGKGLETATILAEIAKELEVADETEGRWDTAPLGALIDHIMVTFHQPLYEELPRLESMARKVLDVHRDKDPERLSELFSLYLEIQAELKQHMMKEEQILFPMIRQGQGAQTGGPVAVMEKEHEAVGGALRRMRELTDDYTVPAEACNTWRALWHGLAALEKDLHQHIHLENNILFPRALAGNA
ncbi:iron-sulfur cluster repair di-iron protein [bacterium]|nr:iron-sulfur cluster repair di-iron protein [bacterium]